MKRAFLLAAATALPVHAAQAPPAPSTPVAPVTVTSLREVDVHGDWCAEHSEEDPGPAPRVVDSWPRPGGVVPAGPLTLRLTFDRPMTCAWVIDYTAEREFCDPVGVWDIPARKTFTMRCHVNPGESYHPRFGDVEGTRFRSRTGVEAEPYAMSFSVEAGSAAADPGSGERVLGRLACNSRRFFGLFNPCKYTRIPASVADRE